MDRMIGPKYIKKNIGALLLLLLLIGTSCGQNQPAQEPEQPDTLSPGLAAEQAKLRLGAEVLLDDRMKLLVGKRVAVIANHTSLVGGTHLVDTLLASGVEVVKVFAPEHGFRGDHDAGAKVTDGKDARTGLPVVSLYGSNKKPSAQMLSDVDLILFDIQDVGARFYTYISTLALAMEAAAENDKSVVVLDRPNPNGWYVEGPVLKEGFESFVGMHPIPIVHGMTVAEYAKMVNEEGWLANGVHARLEVVPMSGYSHRMRWADTELEWVAPSPNLPTAYSAYLYPALCWFEATPISIGRGTEFPFQVVGAPWHKGYGYQVRKDSAMGEPGRFVLHGLEFEYVKFTPRSIPGKSTHPKFEGETCWGAKPINQVEGRELFLASLQLLINFQKEKETVGFKEVLFQPFFYKLTGSKKLKEQIESGMKAEEIYDSWQEDVTRFKGIRKKHLLYEDFE